MELVDQQVRDTAMALLDSEIGGLRKVDFDLVEDIISEEVGESRIGKFFIIRNQKGDVLFESTGAQVLTLNQVPREPQWLTINENGKYIRILNLQLPRVPDRTLQVGLVINEEFISPGYFSRSNLWFFALALPLGFVVAWLMTAALLRPINELSQFVAKVSDRISPTSEMPSIPAHFFKKEGVLSRMLNDEFSKLLVGLEVLIGRMNKHYKISRFWTFQMAHEIKTPLSIMSVELEAGRQKGVVNLDLSESLTREISQASHVVSSFLDWAELENSQKNRFLHANRISKVIGGLVSRLELRYPGRIVYLGETDFEVFSNPLHLEQALQNLILNALNYSPEKANVYISVSGTTVTIKDAGAGISKTVLQRMGEPFNRDAGALPNQKPGHGLGLAWVTSVTRLYDWNFTINSSEFGTTTMLSFPPVSADEFQGEVSV